ncbi:hypothetical protein [Mesorhizobium silamurunense]|uniref:hypothetical protein n=1 Tax=Mesorhizobium silamurunense TaxID=499528 RepID=UPI00177FF51F|nr:hypothetical protein [Mesorhizobium silamurunense]
MDRLVKIEVDTPEALDSALAPASTRSIEELVGDDGRWPGGKRGVLACNAQDSASDCRDRVDFTSVGWIIQRVQISRYRAGHTRLLGGG